MEAAELFFHLAHHTVLLVLLKGEMGTRAAPHPP